MVLDQVWGKQFEMYCDELVMYLQVLRVAMIKLINDDCDDFVNLCLNWVGIEDKIQAIETPLQDFKTQILDLQVHLNLRTNWTSNNL